MASLKAKIKLSTALAFSAAVGVALPTVVAPMSAMAIDPEEFGLPDSGWDYAEATVRGYETVTVTPTMTGDPEKLKDTVWGVHSEQNIPYWMALDPKTGKVSYAAIQISEYGTSSGRTYYEMVAATHGGEEYPVPLAFKVPEHDLSNGVLAYKNDISIKDGTSMVLKGPHYQNSNGDIQWGLNGEFRFDKDSAFWNEALEKSLTIDPKTGDIHVNNADFSSVLPIFEEGRRLIVPVVGKIPQLGDEERHFSLTFAVEPLIRSYFNPGADSIKVGQGSSGSTDMFVETREKTDELNSDRESYEGFSGESPWDKKLYWSDGSLEESELLGSLSRDKGIVFKDHEGGLVFWSEDLDTEGLTPLSSKLRVEPVKELPDWVTFDSEKNTLTASPSHDVAPGEYTFDFKAFTYYDSFKAQEFNERIQDEIENGSLIEDTEYSILEQPHVNPDKIFPVTITVEATSKPGDTTTEVSEVSSVTYPDISNKVGSSGSVAPNVKGNAPVAAPVASEGNQGPVETIREVLANTGANVATLIALGLLASLAGAAFLLYRRRSTN